MTSQLAPAPELAALQRDLFDALEELAANPDSPYAFAWAATVETEQAAIARYVATGNPRITDAMHMAAATVATRCRTLPPPIARIRVCERCDGTGQIVIGIDPSDPTGGTELLGECPECRAYLNEWGSRHGVPNGLGGYIDFAELARKDKEMNRERERALSDLGEPSLADLSA